MAYYRSAQTPDRLKAMVAVAAVHVALGAAILSGLDVDTVTRAVDQLKMIDIAPERPPPPLREPPPPPRPKESSAPKEEAAPANIKSKPTPVVAPEPKIVVPAPAPVNTARVRGPEGLARTAGASNRPGSGTGAGGQGSGFGGGGRGGSGSGDFSGFTPAQRISRIPNREYRRLVAASGRRTGTVGITVKVNTDGRLSNCRIARSSGNGAVDSLMCEMAIQHVRFRPARDAQGRPVAQDITWYPDWSPN